MKNKKVVKCSVDYVTELKTMLDDVGALIERAEKRGYSPSFMVSYGTIRSVSTCVQHLMNIMGEEKRTADEISALQMATFRIVQRHCQHRRHMANKREVEGGVK